MLENVVVSVDGIISISIVRGQLTDHLSQLNPTVSTVEAHLNNIKFSVDSEQSC